MRNGRLPCCDGNQVKRGPWSRAEDLKLTAFIQKYGHDNWLALPKQAGLLRCGKSCRLRWINYLRPDLKRGNFTEEEFETIMKLHETLGNKWSKIASYFPGRTDNEIKNVWNTHLKKRLPKNTNPGSSSNENKLKSPIASSQVATKNKVEQDSVKQVSIELIGVSKNPNESSTSLSSIESNIFNSSQMVGYKPEQKMDSPSKYLGPYNVNNALQDVDKPNPLLEIPSETDYDFWKELDNISVHELGNEYGSGVTKEANKNQLPQKNDAAEQAKDPHSFDFDLMTTPESNSNIDMGYVHWWSPFPQNPGL